VNPESQVVSILIVENGKNSPNFYFTIPDSPSTIADLHATVCQGQAGRHQPTTKPEDLPGSLTTFSFRVKGAKCKSQPTFIFLLVLVQSPASLFSWKQSPKNFST